jgi:hypothetical protein
MVWTEPASPCIKFNTSYMNLNHFPCTVTGKVIGVVESD